MNIFGNQDEYVKTFRKSIVDLMGEGRKEEVEGFVTAVHHFVFAHIIISRVGLKICN